MIACRNICPIDMHRVPRTASAPYSRGGLISRSLPYPVPLCNFDSYTCPTFTHGTLFRTSHAEEPAGVDGREHGKLPESAVGFEPRITQRLIPYPASLFPRVP